MSEEEINRILEYTTKMKSGTPYLEIIKLLDLYEKEKEKNKKLEKLIIDIRHKTRGKIIFYETENIFGLKGTNKQEIYKTFLDINLLVKGNYIFLEDDKFLKEIEGE